MFAILVWLVLGYVLGLLTPAFAPNLVDWAKSLASLVKGLWNKLFS